MSFVYNTYTVNDSHKRVKRQPAEIGLLTVFTFPAGPEYHCFMSKLEISRRWGSFVPSLRCCSIWS